MLVDNQLLKILFMMTISLSIGAQDCEDAISHDGAVCAMLNDFTLFNNKNEFCEAIGNPDTLLNYCKIAVCNVCNSELDECAQLINTAQEDIVYKNFTFTIDNRMIALTTQEPSVSDQEVVSAQSSTGIICTLSAGEDCYRTKIRETYYLNHYSSTDERPPVAFPCCINECRDRFSADDSSIKGGCSLLGGFFSRIEDFCPLYCQNREQGFIPCGSEGCGPQQGCPGTCIESFPSVAVCSNTNQLYTSAEEYCKDLEAGLIDSFTTCGDNPCTQDDCDINKCLESFIEEAYPFTTVCTEEPGFYQTVLIFCLINPQGHFSDAISCGESECTFETCCITVCLQIELYDVCFLGNNEAIPPTELCDIECTSEQGLVEGYIACIDEEGNQRNCTNIDCQIENCITNLENIADEQLICANDKVLYSSKRDFCSSKIQNPSLEIVKYDDKTNLTDKLCCKINCEIKNPVNTFEPRCSSDFIYLNSRDEYCSEYCEDPLNYEDLMCENGKRFCSKTECCVKDCLSSSYIPVCNEKFKLLTHQNYCEEKCENPDTLFIYCPGGCSQLKCKFHHCRINPANTACRIHKCEYTDNDPNDQNKWICASNGQIYRSMCEISELGLTRLFRCTNKYNNAIGNFTKCKWHCFMATAYTNLS